MLLDSSTCDIDHILTKYNCARLEHMCNVVLMERIPGLPLFATQITDSAQQHLLWGENVPQISLPCVLMSFFAVILRVWPVAARSLVLEQTMSV